MYGAVRHPGSGTPISTGPGAAAYFDVLTPLFIASLWLPSASMLDVHAVNLMSERLADSDRLIRLIHYVGFFLAAAIAVVVLQWTFVRSDDNAIKRFNAVRKTATIFTKLIVMVFLLFFAVSAAILTASETYNISSLIILAFDLVMGAW